MGTLFILRHKLGISSWLEVIKNEFTISFALFLQDLEVDEGFELLVLASDGLWDVVPNEVSLALWV